MANMKYGGILILLLVSLGGFCQSYFRVAKISVSQGLSNGRIHDVEQDSLGYLWFATANGLTRYSGSSFKKYQPKPSEKSTDPSVVKLLFNNNQLFALMPHGGVFLYNYKGDRWDKLFEINGEKLTTIAPFGDHQLLIGTIRGFFTYDLNEQVLSSKAFTEFRYIRRVELLQDKLFVSTSKGVQILSVDNNNNLHKEATILKDNDILDFEIDSNHVIWIGTESNGLYHYYNGELKPIPFIDEKLISVREIEVNKDGNVLLAVDRLGFFVLDHFGTLITKVNYNPDDSNSLSQNSINTMYVDQDNITWLGIGEIGLNILYKRNAVFQNIQHQRYGTNTIDNDIIRSILQDDIGRIWFGTEGGVSRLDTNEKWYNYDEKSLLGHTPVLAIESYRGKLLFGTYGEGLLTHNTNTEKTVAFSSQLSLKRIYALLADNDYLWVGGLDGPVNKLKGDSVVAKYSTGQVKTFEKKDNNTLLVGTVEGVYQIDILQSVVTKLTLGNRPITNVYSLKYDPTNDLLWIGNDYGLWRYDYAKDQVQAMESFNASAGAVYSILQTRANQLWLATEKGLYRYFIDKDLYRKYSVDDGQLIDEFGFGARAILMDKRIAFGGPSGAVLLNPDDVVSDNTSPKIFISGLEINGVVPEGSSQDNLNYGNEIELEYDKNTLRFNIDYLKLHGSKEYTLEWQLVGKDRERKVATNQNEIIYRNLNPGTYTLKASVINADGLRASNEIELPIIINNPLWLQPWAFVGYFILISFLVYAIIAINRAIHDRKISEEKIKFFIDVAHDIRTPVSLIRLASDQLVQKNNIEESVSIINRYTTNLNEYVTDLLDFQKSERNKLRVVAIEFDLIQLLKSLIEDFKPMIDQKQLTVELNFPKTLSVYGDRSQIERVFSNLLSNAIKYNYDNGKIWFTVNSAEGKVRIEVKDTGLGIPKNQLDKIFTRFHRADNALANNVRGTGIGLMLSKRIVELHKGNIYCESEENKGSVFIVELLEGKAHFNTSDLRLTIPKERISRITEANVRGKKSILIVEDNEDLLSFIKNAFTDHYHVITATDGKEGLFQIFNLKPDLVITDVMLPSMNGKELCHIIKNDKKLGPIPVVLLTALGGVDDKIAGLEVGADYYMEKPFDIEVLKLTVKNLLKKSQLDREIRDKAAPAPQSPEESLLSNVIEIIHNNLTNPNFTMDQLCDELGLSRSNLFRKIKAVAGLSPSDLIQEIKLNKAMQLLKNDPNIRIDDVAYQCGFNDPKYFSTLFKKHFKRTPSEFQSSHNR